MTTPLLVIGLDAMEAPIIDDLMTRGEMPHLSQLAAKSIPRAIDAACMSTLPGAIWTDIGTGIDSTNHGDYFPIKLHTGERALRPMDPTQHAEKYYWTIAAQAGLDVVSIDQPLVPVFTPPPSVTLVSEWNVHDELWGRGTYPPDLLNSLEDQFGQRKRVRCDVAHDRTAEGYRRLASSLVAECQTKTDLAVELMKRSWDLFTIGFSDGHCAGHQMYHLHQEAEQIGADGSSSSPIDVVYRAVDQAIGRLVAAAPEEAGVLVFTSHGMGPYIGGPQLLPLVLRDLDFGDPRRVPAGVRSLIPLTAIQRLFRHLPAVRTVMERAGFLGRSFNTDVQAMAVNNNRVGAIRLNLAGREPGGVVAPDGANAVLERIESELLALELPDTGERIVERVERADDLAPDHHPDVPDLLVVFRRDLGELTRAVGPTVGLVEQESRRPDYPRTGDHTDESRLWLKHPHVTELESTVRTVDLAPTILELLDVDVPDMMSGESRLRSESI